MTVRELAETIAVAVILFLLLGIEAEGFVIPTGSMDPLLMGRHKEVACPECGKIYQINASGETEREDLPPESRIVKVGTCGNCRCPATVDNAPSYRGDRIFATKVPYELSFLPGAGPPKRWDSVVFKFPQNTDVRYIKRMIGLPNERIRIAHGDLFACQADGSEPFRILRKPASHLSAMQVEVWDDSCRPQSLKDDPRWKRWGGRGWTEPEPGVFLAEAAEGEPVTLTYRHLVPDPDQWQAIIAKRDLFSPPRPTLITDFDAFNTDAALDDLRSYQSAEKAWMLQHWVGDLALSATVETSSVAPNGQLRLILTEAGVDHECRVNLKTGEAVMVFNGRILGEPAATELHQAGKHAVTFSNIDDRLTLEVDGQHPFGDGREFESKLHVPTERDLRPARIRLENGTAAITGLVLKRDLYYSKAPAEVDYPSLKESPIYSVSAMMDLLSSPRQFWRFNDQEPREWTLSSNAYLMLGDNSLWSSDSRAWRDVGPVDDSAPPRKPWEVPQSLIIGKAFCVYWPHGKPIWPDIAVNRDVRLPFRPYFERMKWIR